jgi:release factor glutamine methyltransferase
MRDAITNAMNVRGALREAMAQLESASVPSHALAAELLMMHTLGRDRAWIYSHPEVEIEPDALEKFHSLIVRRSSGIPTQYLTGKQEFWGLEFEVTPAVLIPRPETEHVIEVALERLGAERKNSPLRIADIGTGSGCIAIVLAREFPQAEIFATDISRDALEIAQRNAARYDTGKRIRFIESDLFAAFRDEIALSAQLGARGREEATPQKNAGWQPALRETFDVIVSNPPYIPLGEGPQLQREVRGHEPRIALFAGDDGMAIYAPLIRDAGDFLSRGGLLVLELGHSSLSGVLQIFEQSQAWTEIRVSNDLAGIPRVISAVANA